MKPPTMSGFTGVEFGPDSCTLVRAHRRGGVIELSGAHIVAPSEWPSQAAAAAELLKTVRRQKGFPRVARVVAWGLAEGATPRDIATRAALKPLIAAGFRIDAVVSPPKALAILAADRPRPGGAAAVWLAINRHGAAIAIVRGADLLYSRAFGWNWEGAAVGSQAQLLQRYSIVAHLAPEVRRGVDLVRTKHGVAVEAAVTCGDLPDLRSLTMPLIEELDLEVETLDSVEGLLIPTTARREHLPDSLSAVRLACAAAAGPIASGVRLDVVRLARAAGFVAAVGSLAWIGYVWWARPEPVASRIARSAPSRVERSATTAAGTSTERPVPPVASSSTASPASSPPASSPEVTPPSSSPPVTPPAAAGRARTTPAPGTTSPPTAGASSRATAPRSSTPAPETRRPDIATTTPAPSRPATPTQTAPTGGTGPRQGRPPAPVPSAPRSEPPRPTPPSTAPSAPPATETPRVPPRTGPPPTTAVAPAPEAPAPSAPAATVDPPPARATRPAPLKDPLPVIDTILVSSDRRMAVIDGAFVGIGDTIGQRTVVRIEVDAVFFREPSGLEIRVPIRMRR